MLVDLAKTGQRIFIGEGSTHVSFRKMFFDRRLAARDCLAHVNMGLQVIGVLQSFCSNSLGIDCIRDRVLQFLWGPHPAGQVDALAYFAKRCLHARVDAQELERAVAVELHGLGGRAAVEQARLASTEAAAAVAKDGIELRRRRAE